MSNNIDKELLKDALRELIVEEPETFKQMLKELFKKSEDAQFEELIQKNFNRFDKTFKALA